MDNPRRSKRLSVYSYFADDPAVRNRFSCKEKTILVFCFLLFILLVIGLFALHMLVFRLWKWILLFCTVSFGYPLTNLVTLLLRDFLCSISWVKRQKKWVYFIMEMRESVNLMLFSSSVFLTWSYLLPSHGTKKIDDTGKLHHLLTASSLTLVVATVLGGLKTMLLLIWKDGVVHEQLVPNILRACRSYWCLSILDLQPEQVNTHDHGPQEPVVVPMEDHPDREKTRKLNTISCVGQHSTLYEIQKISKNFINLIEQFPEEGDGTSHILSQCQKINPTSDPNYCVKVKDFIDNYRVDQDNASLASALLKEDHNNQDRITYANFEDSMVKAYKNCVAVGRTLLDAKQLAELLNTVMIVILSVIVFIAWLLLTDIVTKEILVGVASSLLTLACLFSSICKEVLDGMVFLFIKHPLNVGDRCIIDGTQLKVKHMGIMSTTFTIIGQETHEAIYPNSILRSKTITVTHARWSDPF